MTRYTARDMDNGTYHYDLSKDMGDGARFLRISDENAGRMDDTQVRHTALEGNPVDLNMDFATESFNPNEGAKYRRVAEFELTGANSL